MVWHELVQHWQSVLDAVARHGGETSELVIEAPASEEEVAALERELGSTLPASLRETLLSFSKHVEFSWHLPDFAGPEALKYTNFGGFKLSLDHITKAELDRRETIESMRYYGVDPEFIAGWEDKFAFLGMATGDCLAIDHSDTGDGAVLHLSHDDPDVQGWLLGKSFQDFLTRWSPLGCPGDLWGWYPFVSGKDSCIEPTCANAELWKRYLGLKG